MWMGRPACKLSIHKIDPLMNSILEGITRRNGVAALVNTSLNVGEPIAHSARDVVRTLFRARNLHCVVMVGEDGVGLVVSVQDGLRPGPPARSG
jgi:predicted NodU family carbamoyl transferase